MYRNPLASAHGSTSVDDLPNTPQTAYEHAKKRWLELNGDPVVNASRWFVGACVSLALNAVLVLAIVAMLPLKTVVPYMVGPGEAGQVVAKPVEAVRYKPTEALIKAALFEWTGQVFSIDPYGTKKNLEAAAIKTSGKAYSQFKAYLETEQPFQRLLKQPTLTRTVNKITVITPQEGVAHISFTLSESVSNGQPIDRKWRMTVHYITKTPESEGELLRNPLGLLITHFDRAEEF
jgi:type IV secretory pathway component VirB8